MVQAVLGGIGAVSLFVAAIGIANTMMMSIYERTKEIGVIKVLGCSLRNIKQMFLLEAAFIGIYRRTGRKYLKFFDLFDEEGQYIIAEAVDSAYSHPVAERSRIEKDLLKLDERVNILYSLQQGRMFALFLYRMIGW